MPGEKNLITSIVVASDEIRGTPTTCCTVYPALSLVRDGFDVQVVADAGGSPTKMADDIALRRMENLSSR